MTPPDLLAFVRDPESPETNYRMARFYLEQGQTAAAVSFLLRCAERSEDVNLQYECLIEIGHCFDKQGRRDNHALIMYRKAQILLPKRPEAYFFIARLHERRGRWSECYSMAELGLVHTDWKNSDSNDSIDYPGPYALLFEKAVSGWWVNREMESRHLFLHISEEYHSSLDPIHRQAVYNNILTLGIGPESVTHRYYDRSLYGRFRSNFPGLENIQRNFSQCYQDLFVLAALEGKRNGRYLEIGSAGPFYGNNTALLEKEFGWKGVGVELNQELVKQYEEERNNVVICADALTLDYKAVLSVLAKDGVVDYLQLDIDPADVTYSALLKIPFDEYKFAVITYEHDHYCDITKTYRDLSREYLKSKGYELIVSDVSPEGNFSFEDWWIHPDLISQQTLKKLRFWHGSPSISAYEYLFPEQKAIPDFEWGTIQKNEWFRSLVQREVFEDRVYERFVQVEEGDIVVDLGASVGPFIRSVREKRPKIVFAFEPSQELFQTLIQNTKQDRVFLVNFGIGSSTSTQEMTSLFSEKGYSIGDGEPTQAECIRFDDFISRSQISKIDFLKTDCEGGEYDVFTEENMDWILKNVRKISGEFHLGTPEQKEKFRKFRDTYLKKFPHFHVESIDYVDIKHSLFTEWFLEYYSAVNIHIDNRYPKSYWRRTKHPTLEVTTSIPKKGCVVDCAICPQRTLEKAYTSDIRFLTLENFKKLLESVPIDVRITFSGFVEPWLNAECTDMVEYAYYRGHPVSVFTTGVGMKPSDVERLSKLLFAGDPNGGFVLHLPDQERIAKHPINRNFIETMEAFAKTNIVNFRTMCMTPNVHDSITHVFPSSFVPEFWNRAGNLIGEAILKEELMVLSDRYKGVHRADEPRTCGCVEDLYHNVLLPNGDVSLCCMDYGLENIIGNLYQDTYDNIVPEPKKCFDICRSCENGILSKS